MVRIVRAAMEQVSGSTHILLSLNPDDVELVQQWLSSSPTESALALDDPAGPLCRARRLPDRERAREGGMAR